jgi:hypothetical protein
LSLECGAAAVAFDVHFEDRCVVDEAVDGGERHSGIGENFVPFAKWLISGDEDGIAFIPGADQFEEDGCFSLILGD